MGTQPSSLVGDHLFSQDTTSQTLVGDTSLPHRSSCLMTLRHRFPSRSTGGFRRFQPFSDSHNPQFFLFLGLLVPPGAASYDQTGSFPPAIAPPFSLGREKRSSPFPRNLLFDWHSVPSSLLGGSHFACGRGTHLPSEQLP